MSARRSIARVSSPKRKASTIADRKGAPNQRAVALVDAIKAVLHDAIKAGGSSLRDHRQADGTLGYFQHSFRVYDREGEPCPRLQRHDQAHRPERPLDILLSGVSEIAKDHRERAPMAYENLIVETKGRVGVITLNRPQALNALNRALVLELTRRSTPSKRMRRSAAC